MGLSVYQSPESSAVGSGQTSGAHVIGVDRGDPHLDSAWPLQHNRHVVLDNFLRQ